MEPNTVVFVYYKNYTFILIIKENNVNGLRNW